ncbi:MAG: hypothetical protein K2W84_01455 [Burkholderiales bacterium]|nr:hypothetical protein [Burkholderiales bacterium]
MKNLIIAAALAASLLSASAHAVGRSADITVYDRVQQRILPVYLHEGRHYVAGQPGNEYEVRIRNRQHSDMLAVVAVDGVNALSGDTADWEQGGYVLGPQQAYALKGWRKSLDRIAAFYFTALPDSYAARTGRPDHVGVIGVAIFRRKPEPPAAALPQPVPRAAESAGQAMADSASRAEAPAMAQKPARLGTGHGRSERSVVTMTEFERASSVPAEVITIYYDSHSNLVAQGVIRLPPVARPLPLPFPGRFVPDPS